MTLHRLAVFGALVVLPALSQVQNPVSNWSGYALTGAQHSVTKVMGSWTVPQSNCNGLSASDTGVFVGIDGYRGATVEQAGTAALCNNGKLEYYAFYEFAPGKPSKRYPVSVGDIISAAVSCKGGSEFTVELTDETRSGKPLFTAHQPAGFQASCSTAEWIVEDPAEGLNKPLFPLTNFKNVNFTLTSATVAGVTGPIGSFASNLAITMTNNGSSTNTTRVIPTPLIDESSFSVSLVDVVYTNFGPVLAFDSSPSDCWTINGYLGQGGQQVIADQFTPSGTYTFEDAMISLYLFSGPDSIDVYLQTDSSGQPGAIIEEIPIGGLGSAPGILVANSAMLPTLQSGTPYWLTLVAGEDSVLACWNWNSIGDTSNGTLTQTVNQSGSPLGPWPNPVSGSAVTRSVFEIDGEVQ